MERQTKFVELVYFQLILQRLLQNLKVLVHAVGPLDRSKVEKVELLPLTQNFDLHACLLIVKAGNPCHGLVVGLALGTA